MKKLPRVAALSWGEGVGVRHGERHDHDVDAAWCACLDWKELNMKNLLKCVLLSLLLAAGTSMAAERGTREEAVAMVKKAVAHFNKVGKEAALADFNDPKGKFVDRDLYLFVFGTSGDGVELANGANIKLVGKHLIDLRDADGKYMVKEFLATANSAAGSGWIEYKWPNPVTKGIDAKASYVEKVGDILIGCGIYK
jgi:cytochrome c